MEPLGRTIILGAAAWACIVSSSSALYAESPLDEPPPYCTVFHHFVKSGGSSVKRQLSQRCMRKGFQPPGLITEGAKTTPITALHALHNASVIMGSGELIREPLKAIGRDCEYFTMLRDPIDRLVSAFYYCPTDHDFQDRPSKWCGDSEGENTDLKKRLMDFLKNKWGNKGFTSMMPSVVIDPDFELGNPEHEQYKRFAPRNINTQRGWLLHGEIKRILSTYTAVGIFEEWELSMRLFNAKVKSPVRHWDADMVANPGTRSEAREELLAWAHTNAELHNIIAADMLLYHYGVALFRQQTTETLGVKWT